MAELVAGAMAAFTVERQWHRRLSIDEPLLLMDGWQHSHIGKGTDCRSSGEGGFNELWGERDVVMGGGESQNCEL